MVGQRDRFELECHTEHRSTGLSRKGSGFTHDSHGVSRDSYGGGMRDRSADLKQAYAVTAYSWAEHTLPSNTRPAGSSPV